jgi:DNA-binding response OmpR family regulator
MKILVCEDNRLALRTFAIILERANYKYDIAEDGNMALDLLNRNEYSLLIVDLHMPYHSGLEVIKYIRTEMKRKTPILVVTAFSDIQTQKNANELGIDGYVLKPYNPVDIINNIRQILEK